MTHTECRTCKWRGGREHPGKCLVLEDCDFDPIPYSVLRAQTAPCGPDAWLYEQEEK